MVKKSNLYSEWEIRLEQWHASRLSGKAWCLKQDISYCVFLYWKKKLKNKSSGDGEANFLNPFVELVDPSKNSAGIEIKCHGTILCLSRDFDGATFQRCIQLLRGF